MAIFHMHAQVISRSAGRSAVAASAYRSASCLKETVLDKETGLNFEVVHDYSKKKGVAFSVIMAPDNAPNFALNRETLWNTVQNIFEKRKDAQVAREIDIALPVELSLEENKALLTEFVHETFVCEGMIADVNMHYDNPSNPHAHIMLTTREIVPVSNGRQIANDNINSSASIDAKSEYYTFGLKVRSWNSNEFLLHSRRMLSGIINKHLSLAGIDQEVSHLSHIDRGISLMPSIKEGVGKKVRASDRAEINRQIDEYNIERIKEDPTLILDKFAKNKIVFSKEEISSLLFDFYGAKESELISALDAVMSSDKLVLLDGRNIEGRKLYTLKARYELEKDFITRLSSIKTQEAKQLDTQSLKSPSTPDHSLAISSLDLDSKTLLEGGIDKALLLANQYLGTNFKEIILSDEQRKVALGILNDKSQVSAIEGLPGSGKTTLMRKIASIYKKHGYKTIGVAVSNSASRELSLAANLDNGMNITQLRYKLEKLLPTEFADKLNLKMDYYKDDDLTSRSKPNLLSPKTVLIVDEASQVDLTEMHYIIRAVQKSGAKLILLGDSNQLPSITFPGAYEKISEIFTPNRLEDVKRQENPLHREATKLLAEFKIPDAIKLYRKTGVFRFLDNLDRAKEALARSYVDEYIRIYNEAVSNNTTGGNKEGGGLIQDKIIALAYTNQDVTSLNLSIREKLIEQNAISSVSRTYHITRSGISSLIQLAKGDQIVFTKNNNYLNISNSDIGEVVGFGSRIDQRNNQLNQTLLVKIPTNIDKNSITSIFTQDTRIIEIDNHYFKGFDYGYAKNIYKSQGKTYDKVYGLVDSHTGYNMFNVSATRHRTDLKLYVSNEILQEALYRKISQDPLNAKLSYTIKPDKHDEMSDKYAGIISLVQRRGDTSLGIDYASKLYQNDQTQDNPQTPEEILIDYIETRSSLIKTREAIDRWLEVEQAKGRIHHYNDHPYIEDLNNLLASRKNLASQITDNYQTYKKLLTKAKINYSTIEKHAGKNEYKYYFNKNSYNSRLSDIEELPALLNQLRSIAASIKQLTGADEMQYQLSAAEINHQRQDLKEITTKIISEIEEHKLSIIKLDLAYKESIETKAKTIDQIEDGKNYINHSIKSYLSRIYKESPDQILETYEKLQNNTAQSLQTEQLDQIHKIHHIKQNPSILGNINGIGLLGISISKTRENALDHLKSIDHKLIKYEEYKKLIPILEEKLESGELDREIKNKETTLKSLQNKLPPFQVEEFIRKAHHASKDPDHNVLISWVRDKLTIATLESFEEILNKENALFAAIASEKESKTSNNKVKDSTNSNIETTISALDTQNKKEYLKQRDALLEKYEYSHKTDDSAKLYRNIAGSLQPDLAYKILKNLVFKEVSEEKTPKTVISEQNSPHLTKAIFVIVGQDLARAKPQELDQIKSELLPCCHNILSYKIEEVEVLSKEMSKLYWVRSDLRKELSNNLDSSTNGAINPETYSKILDKCEEYAIEYMAIYKEEPNFNIKSKICERAMYEVSSKEAWINTLLTSPSPLNTLSDDRTTHSAGENMMISNKAERLSYIESGLYMNNIASNKNIDLRLIENTAEQLEQTRNTKIDHLLKTHPEIKELSSTSKTAAKNLAEQVVDYGFKYGEKSVNEILPHYFSILKNIAIEQAEMMKEMDNNFSKYPHQAHSHTNPPILGSKNNKGQKQSKIFTSSIIQSDKAGAIDLAKSHLSKSLIKEVALYKLEKFDAAKTQIIKNDISKQTNESLSHLQSSFARARSAEIKQNREIQMLRTKGISLDK